MPIAVAQPSQLTPSPQDTSKKAQIADAQAQVAKSQIPQTELLPVTEERWQTSKPKLRIEMPGGKSIVAKDGLIVLRDSGEIKEFKDYLAKASPQLRRMVRYIDLDRARAVVAKHKAGMRKAAHQGTVTSGVIHETARTLNLDADAANQGIKLSEALDPAVRAAKPHGDITRREPDPNFTETVSTGVGAGEVKGPETPPSAGFKIHPSA